MISRIAIGFFIASLIGSIGWICRLAGIRHQNCEIFGIPGLAVGYLLGYSLHELGSSTWLWFGLNLIPYGSVGVMIGAVLGGIFAPARQTRDCSDRCANCGKTMKRGPEDICSHCDHPQPQMGAEADHGKY